MKKILTVFFALLFGGTILAQTTITGTVTDASTKEPIPGVNVIIIDEVSGTSTDFDGKYSIEVDHDNAYIKFSYVGMTTITMKVGDNSVIDIAMTSDDNTLDEVVVSASRTPESIRESPVSIERMGVREIQNTPSASFYDGLENLKGVELKTNSLTFKSLNTRGFASFANTRFVQIVDGMDSAAPALNFVMGNLTGISELDVHSIELLPGAASALYGANAFNGILFMTSKNPFDYQGASAYVKGGITSQEAAGDNSYVDFGMRFAHAFSDKFAAKVSFSMISGTDWIANDERDLSNPGATRANTDYDGLNIYGDEVGTTLDFDFIAAGAGITLPPGYLGKASVTRTGYKDAELIDYEAKSFKGDVSLHYRPTGDDLEIILQGKAGVGSTIYQGANRYYLDNFKMNMAKLEIRNKNFFARIYRVEDNAGKSMDSRFAGININRRWKSDEQWFTEYAQTFIGARLGAATGTPLDEASSHALARQQAQIGRLEPGTPEFNAVKDEVANDPDFNTGAQFLDNSKIYQAEANYNFSHLIDDWADFQIGGNFRSYELVSQGTIFTDTDGPIEFNEYGAYAQFSKKFLDEKLKFTISGRYDKNELMDGNVSPRVSFVYSAGAKRNHNIRASYQTGFRNPTTQDFYIGLDVGNALLVGSAPENLDRYRSRPQLVSPTGQALGFGNNIILTGRQAYDNAWTLSSVYAFSASAAAGAPNPGLLEIAENNYVQPEKITAYELGYRGRIGRVNFDISGYYNDYKDFIATKTVISPYYGNVNLSDIHPAVPVPNALLALSNGDMKPFQVYTNSDSDITSYGFLVGADFRVFGNYNLGVNYTLSKFDFDQSSDPDFQPQFNTPENSVKISFGNTDLFENFGFNVSYRYNDEYLWESTFGTGMVDSSSVFDAQVSYAIPGFKS
ncbi:MAG: TonB-dependent receptor, partial [Flavobacteriaceae bacterium]|nr:TonB-dependent receptor [Flavobacteriaceae bacterium]